MRFPRKLTLAGAVVLAGLCGPAVAASGQGTENVPSPKIAVIDVQAILRDSAAAKSVRVQRDELLQRYQNEFSKEEDALRNSQRELERQRTLVSPEALEEKSRAFQKQVADFQRKVQDHRRALEESYTEAMGELQKALIKVTDEIAQETGSNMVVIRTQVFLFDPKMDITDTAMDRLNKRLPSVDLPAPKPTTNAGSPAKKK